MNFAAANKERLFWNIIENLNEGVVVLDGDLRVLSANVPALGLSGREAPLVIGQNVRSSFPLMQANLVPLFPDALPKDTEAVHFTDVIMQNLQHGQIITAGCVLKTAEAGLSEENAAAYILILRDIGEHKKLSALINFQENCDPLTKMYKPEIFIAKLQETLGHIKQGVLLQALLYIDIDFFQQVKNIGGHEASRTLLRDAAELIRQNVDRQDITGYLEKDDFAVILLDCSRENTNGVAKRLLNEFRRHSFRFNGKDWNITISIGAYTLTGNDHFAKDTLKKAYTACREAYKKGGDRFALVSAAARYYPY